VEDASAREFLGAFARRPPGAAATAAVTGIATAEPEKTPAQQRLDAYRATYAGPYRVDGQSVTASPQFRMNHGQNQANAPYLPGKGVDRKSEHGLALLAACSRAHVSEQALCHCLVGGPTASELRSVTQALIDAGMLPSGPGSVQARIKTMQWQHGIGIDCTDYVIGGAMAANGKTRAQIEIPYGDATLPMTASDYFLSADANPHLVRTDARHAKTGDVFCLTPTPPETIGHRAVVYANKTLDDSRIAELAHEHGSIVSRFAQGGPVHAIEVDASWGAGPHGGSWGGVRRDTWLYNESTKQWAELNQRQEEGRHATFELTHHGPADEKLHGVYRFR